MESYLLRSIYCNDFNINGVFFSIAQIAHFNLPGSGWVNVGKLELPPLMIFLVVKSSV